MRSCFRSRSNLRGILDWLGNVALSVSEEIGCGAVFAHAQTYGGILFFGGGGIGVMFISLIL